MAVLSARVGPIVGTAVGPAATAPKVIAHCYRGAAAALLEIPREDCDDADFEKRFSPPLLGARSSLESVKVTSHRR